MKIHDIVVKKIVSALGSIPGMTYTLKYEGETYTNEEPKKVVQNITSQFIDQITGMKPWEVRVVSVEGVDPGRLQPNVCASLRRLYGKGNFTTVQDQEHGTVEVMVHDVNMPRKGKIGFNLNELFTGENA